MHEVEKPAESPGADVRDRLFAFAERTPDLVGVTDDAGRVLYVNPAARKRLGLTGDEPPVLTADLFPPSAFERYFEEVRPALLRHGCWHGEMPWRAAGGDTVEVEMTVVSGNGRGGEVGWLATVAHDLTERRRAEDELRRQTLYDDLTGVARRALLVDRIDLALRRVGREGGLVGVVFLDVDNLKAINDTFGHQAGDAVLVEVGRRLTAVVRSVDTVARVGGDEFVVLLDQVRDEREALQLAGRLEELLEHDPVDLGDGAVKVSVSLGVGLGQTGATPEQLLRRADIAMYESKSDRQDRLGATARTARRVLPVPSAHELAVALTQRRITAAVEPVVDLRTGDLVGLQALARWHRAEGELPAAEFVHLVDGSGMNVALDLAVLRSAAAFVVARPERDTRLYLHLSARVMAEPRIGYLVAEILEDALLEPGRLHVEIAEHLLARRAPGVVDGLAALRDIGVHVVVSDVGAHSPPILDLADGTVAALRVSPRVVTGATEDPRLARTMAGVVGLGHGLGLEVIAVGVETAAQRDLVVGLGCDLGEGEALSPPTA